MDIKTFLKSKLYTLAVFVVISLVPSIIFFRTLGIKDSAMIFVATFLLAVEIYLIKIDKKKSLLLFIVSFPILVTARKLFYFNFLFIRLNYEALYILLFAILDFKNLMESLKLKFKKVDKLNRGFLLLVSFFVVFALNSSLFSYDLFSSLGYVFIGVIVPVLFFLIIISNFNGGDKKNIFYALILSTNLSCLYGFSQVIMGGLSFSEISSNRSLLTFGYHNVNIFGSNLLFVLPLLLELVFYHKNTKKERLFLYTSLSIFLISAGITFTRGIWLTLPIIFFVVLLSKKYKALIIAFTVGGLALAKPVLSFILSRGSSYNTSIFTNDSAVSRIQGIFGSFKMISENPFGIGGETFHTMYEKYFMQGFLLMPKSLRDKVVASSNLLEHAHNLWLQIGVEFGIVCLIVFILIVINRIKVIFKDYTFNRGVFTSIVAWVIYSTSTGMEFNHKGVITGTLILWLLFALIYLSGEKKEKDNK